MQRHVRLFKNGRNQAVRIPKEFELPGDEAIMYSEGDRLIVESVTPPSLLAILDMLEPLDEETGPVEDLPPDPVDL